MHLLQDTARDEDSGPIQGRGPTIAEPWIRYLKAVLACAVGVILAHPAHPGTVNGFDLANATIPPDQIISGGVPRDGIPALTLPTFVSIPEVRYLGPDDQVVSVTIGEETRAYPLRILAWHEIVNDTFGRTPVAVTYCPLCGTAMVFDRIYKGQLLSFGVSGLLYESDVLMYDRQTGSLWSQLGMVAISGRYVGTQLRWLSSEQMTWKAWREKYPKGRVLSTDSGGMDYSREAYAEYEQSGRPMFPVSTHRRDLKSKDWVAGIIIDGQAKAYRLRSLPNNEFVEDEFAGTPLRIRYDRKARSFVAERRDTAERLPSVQAYWFAWQAFYPDTALRR